MKGGNVVVSASELEVYVGIVSIRDSSHQELSRLADPDYEVEKYLFETGKAHLDAGVYEKAIGRFHEVIRQSGQTGGP